MTKTNVTSVPFVDLAAQYAAIKPEVDAAMAGVLERCDFILGREAELFDQAFAQYCGARHAIGVDSGMSALSLTLRALGIGAGDEVITSANTFIATALSISGVGAKPVLVDVEPNTFRMDLDRVEAAITPRTRALMPVHLYGHPENMNALLEIAERHGLMVIEDACQAHGARYDGRRAGSMGVAAAFSFYPAKNLGAYGDGGMIVTNDDEVAASVNLLRNYGQRKKYHHVAIGENHRLDTLQAAVLRVKLRYLDDWNAARRRHADAYRRLLAGSGALLPTTADGSEPVWHLYVIQVAHRDALRHFLAERGIATGIHYPIPIHLQPAYAALGYGVGSFPVAEREAERIVSLPMYAELTTEQIEYVADAIAEFAATRGLDVARA